MGQVCSRSTAGQQGKKRTKEEKGQEKSERSGRKKMDEGEAPQNEVGLVYIYIYTYIHIYTAAKMFYALLGMTRSVVRVVLRSKHLAHT